MTDYLISGPVSVGTATTNATVRGDVFFANVSTTPGQVFGTTAAGQMKAQAMTRGDLVTQNAAGETAVVAGTKSAGRSLIIDAAGDSVWANAMPHECTVDAAGTGNFTTIGAAITAGCTRIFVKAGTYSESADVVIPNFGAIIGESAGSVVLNLTAGARVVLDGSGGTIELAGTISITSGTSAVTGAGTTFTNLSSGNFILLGTEYYEIDVITDATNLTITEIYRGVTLSGVTWLGQPMFAGMLIKNLIISGSSSTGLFIRAIRHSTIENCLVRSCTPNATLTLCSQMRIIGFISQSSVGAGITFSACNTIGVSTMNIYNSTSHGILINASSFSLVMDAVLVSTTSAFGINVTGGASLIKLTDSVVGFTVSTGINTDAGTFSCVIDSCTIHNCGGPGLDFDGISNVISNCHITLNTGSGMFAGDGGVVDGNIIDFNGSDGIDMTTDTDCVISNNRIVSNVGEGIASIAGTNNMISGNQVSSNGADGIDVVPGGTNTVIFNNICNSNGDAGIEVDATDCILTGNRCTANTGEGIHIQAGGDDAIVTSNNVTGNTGTNLLIDGGAAGVISANNKT